MVLQLLRVLKEKINQLAYKKQQAKRGGIFNSHPPWVGGF